MPQYEVDAVYIIHNNEHGIALEIGDWPEAPNIIELRPSDADSKEHYGDFSLTMDLELARAIREALSKKINDLESSMKGKPL